MSVIYTVNAKCRDCYKCLRLCPVQAIKFSSGGANMRAQVREDECILDGRCVAVCPQKAKKVRRDVDLVQSWLEGGEKVAVSLAPSFVVGLPASDPGLVVAGLKKSGFAIVQETALGAELAAREQRRLSHGMLVEPQINSSCPVVVNLVERHYPGLIPHLAPLVSPMVAHARFLKQRDPELKVVFIGPCIAKKEEADQLDDVDAVLTFQELWDWWNGGEFIADVAPAKFDPPHANLGRLFPIDGGMLKTAGIDGDLVEGQSIAISGMDNCLSFMETLSQGKVEGIRTVEMLACPGGCINGPAAAAQAPLTDIVNLFQRRQRLLAFYRTQAPKEPASLELAPRLLYRDYEDRGVNEPMPSEEEIRAVLAQVGKVTKEDELNCGACGYSSCRDKAVAVCRGHAELEMCIPYMRQKAESIASLVLNALPAGVIVVDGDLTIKEINNAARELFHCSDKVIGGDVGVLLEPEHFRRVLQGRRVDRRRVAYHRHGLVVEQTIFFVPEHSMIVGIFTNVTQEEERLRQVQEIKQAAAERAQEVINKQMKVAQEIASLLGETTAETKLSLIKLIELLREEQ
ncbi:MAG: [Fe-Fe] hydrogenase large subunit C-terminal domain-containing protein [Limnochordia bacterium]|jgi:iron only hydrogenase large subunit-like protein|nr:PAS domain-containing protein [Bacillota bacterium]